MNSQEIGQLLGLPLLVQLAVIGTAHQDRHRNRGLAIVASQKTICSEALFTYPQL